MIFGGRFGIRRQRLNSNARIASTAPFACGAVLSWAESTQRPPLSWKKAPKEPKRSCRCFSSFIISFPSLLRIQHGSLIVAYAALRTPSLLKLPASFCLRRPIKNFGWRGSIGVWIKVFNFFVGFLLVTFLFQKKSNRKRRINHPSLPLSSSPSYTPRSGEHPAGRWPALPHPWR